MAEIDREKVINDLQDAVNDDWMWQHADYYAKAMENAIALLKEQEPVNPIRIVNDNNFLYDLCGFCGKTLPVSIDYDRARYCPFCGKKVKWE